MSRWNLRSILPGVLAWASIACLVLPATASARNSLTIRGRVLDGNGNPIPQAQVFLEGSRRADVPVDKDGKYSLSLPSSELGQITQSSLSFWLIARRTGWRFQLPNGEPRLRFEIRGFADHLGGVHLQVRSNDAQFSSALASAAVLQGNLSGVVDVPFVGLPEKEPEPRDLKMTAVENVRLTGGAATSPAAESKVPGKEPGSVSSSSPATAQISGAGSTSQRPVEGAASPSSSTRRPRVSSGSPVSAPRDSASTRGYVATKKTPELEPPATRSRRSQTPANPGPSQTVRPPSRATAETVAPTTQATKSEKLATETSLPPPRDGTKAQNPQPSVSKPKTGATTVSKPGTTRRGKTTVRESARPTETAAKDKEAAPQVAIKEECACQIEGTIEVQSDRPLPKRVRITVSLESDPTISDTVELFMGSPRPFAFQTSSCTQHRVTFQTRDKNRFVLTSPDPVVDCKRGGFKQIKLVLEPAGRWRASR
jgi:hypothetical protein